MKGLWSFLFLAMRPNGVVLEWCCVGMALYRVTLSWVTLFTVSIRGRILFIYTGYITQDGACAAIFQLRFNQFINRKTAQHYYRHI